MGRPMYTIGKNQSIKDIFEVLTENRILSVPIFDKGKYTRFIDMLDLLVYSIQVIGEDAIRSGYETFKSHQGFVASCKELADGSHRNPWMAVDIKSSVQHAIDLMNKGHLHRLAVVNPDGELSDILTQSSIIRYLYNNVDDLPNADQTLEELKLGTSSVHTVPMDRSAYHAFKQIIELNVSGLGVTGSDGKLVANISASDIKKFGYDNYLLSNMFLTLDKFLVLDKENGAEIPPVITVTSNDTLRTLLKRFSETRVHRLYIKDGDELKGVVAMGDVLTLFA